jgi:hypothetical protein
MLSKFSVLIIISIGLWYNAFSQHVDLGLYNDWDYGPNGVYGNLPLIKTIERGYYKIERADSQTVSVKQFNPSGIVIHTAVVRFLNGILLRVEEADQWGEIYEYRTYGQVSKNEFIVTDLLFGKNIFLPCKYAKYIYQDELLTEVQYYSFAGILTENENGVAIIRYKKYDDKIRFAEIREMSFYDAQGHPVIAGERGYHKVINEYDEHDNKLSELYFDINDHPVTIQKGRQAGTRYAYDGLNNQTSREFINIEGQPTANINGIARIEFRYSHGYITKNLRFDSLHLATSASSSGDGFSILTYECDSRGNRTKESYFDPLGKPINNHSGDYAQREQLIMLQIDHPKLLCE